MRASSGFSLGLKGKKSTLSSRMASIWGRVRTSRMWATKDGSVSRSGKRSERSCFFQVLILRDQSILSSLACLVGAGAMKPSVGAVRVAMISSAGVQLNVRE